MTSSAVEWWLLSRIPGLGDAVSQRLIDRFGSPARIFAADLRSLCSVEGVTPQAAEEIIRLGRGSSQESAHREIEELRASSVELIARDDPGYPHGLSHIHDAPLLLYMKGALEEADRTSVAVVGSRHPTPYGLRMAEKIAGGLARAGCTVVSGLARGIDGAAHRAALEARGRTIAVLGSGIDRIYPPEHEELAEQIVRVGAIVTEYPPGAAPLPANFPRRNRIISGLSSGTVVVEAAAGSGSLITALLALEQGREVFAVPGNVGAKNSEGTNRLIKSGARLVEDAEDIVTELLPQWGGIRPISRPPEMDRTAEDLPQGEATIADLLTDEPCHPDEMVARTGLGPAQVATALVTLELRGVARQLPGNLYVRR